MRPARHSTNWRGSWDWGTRAVRRSTGRRSFAALAEALIDPDSRVQSAARAATDSMASRGVELDLALREQTGLAVSIADESLNCVALGTGKALEYEKQLRHAIDYDS